MTPPELGHEKIDVFAKGFWQLEYTHGLGGNGLDDCLQEDLLSNMR